MDKAPQVTLHSTAHFFLEGLNELGIEYLFCNFGTDYAPLIEEMARWRAEGRKFPKALLCPHENTAVQMAIGYAMATGRGQAVMVHVDAGTANAAMGLHDACRSRVPMILIAGKAPYTVRGELPGSRDTYVHFIQEPFDQGGIVRNYVKWEWTLPSGVITKEVLRRAHSVAHSDPRGPVYLMLPRETLNLLYNLLDLYLVTSRSEGGPRSLMEAAAAQCKVLSTRVGLAEDLLDPACIYASPIDAVSLIEQDISGNGLARTVVGQYQRVMAHHRPEAVGPSFEDLYKKLLAKPARHQPVETAPAPTGDPVFTPTFGRRFSPR